jgi:hypothetical protein
MPQIKLAALLLMPMAFACSVTTTQAQQSDSLAKATAPADIKPKTEAVQEEVYGAYVPYVAPAKKVSQPQGEVASSLPEVCPPAQLQPDPVYGSYVAYTGHLIKEAEACYTQSAQTAIVSNPPPNSTPVQPRQDLASSSPVPNLGSPSKATPRTAEPVSATALTCELQPDPVYGSYVPYTGPKIPACFISKASGNSAAQNSTPAQPRVSQQSSLIGGTAHPPDDVILAAGSPSPSGGTSGDGTSGYVRPVPPPIAVKEPRQIRPFRSVAIGFKADTLGAGFELATPVSRSLNLRSSINVFAFNDNFSIDGVNYDARLHLKSSETTLDWFPGRHGFHISPGILYVKNSLSAPAFVRPGQTFVLGTQAFTNSVDDPVNGSSSVIYPHNFAPMLLLGFGNIIPRSGRHLSIPFEFGVAYTGAPQISVTLDGTACTTEGCVSFAGNTQAQDYLKQEVHILNEDLKKFPVFPIVSLGLAYHF